MDTLTKWLSKPLFLFLTLMLFFIIIGTIQDIYNLISYLNTHPPLNLVRLCTKIISEFWTEFLLITFFLFYIKMFFDKLINVYVRINHYSLSMLVDKGKFKANDFKIKNNEIITKFYKQRKAIKFLQKL